MLRHYITAAVRSLLRQRLFTVVNLAGLTVGLTASLLILAYVQIELSYDRSYPEADRLVRLYSVDSTRGQTFRSAVMLGQAGPRIKDVVAGVDAFVRVHNERVILEGDDRPFEEQRGFAWTDPGVFDVFGLTLLSGDAGSALSAPGSMVLTPDLARKLFGETDAIGRTVRLDATHDMIVTGIMEPIAGPSHLHLTALGSYSTLEPLESPWVGANQGWTYLRLAKGADRTVVERAINASLDQIVTWFDLTAMKLAYRLQPIVDIRLHSEDLAGAGAVSDIRTVWLISVIGILVLLMACVNFMNLASARALHRSREVGLRKSIGATRGQIVLQFLQESVGMSIVALVLSLILIQIVLPLFNDVAGTTMSISYFLRPEVIAAMLILTLITGIVAGSHPAIHLSSFSPVLALRGIDSRGKKSGLRRGLVVFQFAVSAALIMATLVIRAQLDYMRGADVGFDADNLVVLRTGGMDADPKLLRDALEALPDVEAVSIASGLPIGGAMQSGSEINGRSVMIHYLFVDGSYLEVTGLEMAAGRWYEKDRPGDARESIVVNETLVRLQEWENPVGRQIRYGANEDGSPRYVTVIGVVRDFHTGSMHSEIMPAYISARPAISAFSASMLVRLRPGASIDRLAGIEDTWRRYNPDRPLSTYFADDIVRFMYASEARLSRVLLLFTVLAMMIAGLGLFGLAAYSAERRTREIGIRKALGATATQVTRTLSGEFMLLTLVALVLGIPVALWAASTWLESFAYHVRVGPGLVLAGCAAVALVMLLSVTWQAIRAARLDPVESLRRE